MSNGFVGLDQIVEELRALDGKVIPKVARPAVQMGAQAAVLLAKNAAPKRTGRTASSYHVAGATTETPDFDPAGKPRYQELEAEPDSSRKAAAVVGSTYFVARFVEYGTRRQPAQYIMGSAVAAVEPLVGEMLAELMDELFERAA
jgi:HK97 gp10 family phage protein